MSSAACAFADLRRAWEDEAAAKVSDGVAVRRSRRMEGGSDESCCSWITGPVAALATGNGEHHCTRVPSEQRRCRLSDAGGEGYPALSTN